MGKNLTALQRLYDLSQNELQQAAKALKAANEQLNQGRQQLAQLEQYREEYNQRLNRESQNSFSTANYRNFRRFIGTLDYTIKEQNRRIEVLSAHSLEMKKQWQSCQQRCQAYETLINRQRQQALQRTQKAEQRTNDELATQLFLRPNHFS